MTAEGGRVWWSLMCDDDHRWEVETADVPEPPPEVMRCPVDGAAAVTARREEPADHVRICLVPAARVSDPVVGTVSHEGEWYLEIVSSDGTRALRSERPWTWPEAVERASRFQNLAWSDAERRWRRTFG